MLLPYTTLTYYGPCAAAAVGVSNPAAAATMKANVRLGASGVALASSPKAAMTRGLYMKAFGISTALSPVAVMRNKVRLGAVGKVNSLTQGDVAAAVWGQSAAQYNLAGTFGAKLNAAGGSADPWSVTLEGTYTAADLLRIAAAVLAGDATGTNQPGETVFKSLDGTKDRVTATQIEGSRVITAIDPS